MLTDEFVRLKLSKLIPFVHKLKLVRVAAPRPGNCGEVAVAVEILNSGTAVVETPSGSAFTPELFGEKLKVTAGLDAGAPVVVSVVVIESA